MKIEFVLYVAELVELVLLFEAEPLAERAGGTAEHDLYGMRGGLVRI